MGALPWHVCKSVLTIISSVVNIIDGPWASFVTTDEVVKHGSIKRSSTNLGGLRSSFIDRAGKIVFSGHESQCSEKQVQENVVHLVILCTL